MVDRITATAAIMAAERPEGIVVVPGADRQAARVVAGQEGGAVVTAEL